MVNQVTKGARIIYQRLTQQGVKTTAEWVYGRAIPKLTGIPLKQFSQITESIWIGGQINERGKDYLIAAGINNSVNMRIEYDDEIYKLNLIGYCYLPTIDDDAPSMEHLQEGIKFITDAVERGEKVYIHCAGGIGRAPTMAAAYFVSSGYSLDEALTLIRKVRPFINVTAPQIERLKELEAVYHTPTS